MKVMHLVRLLKKKLRGAQVRKNCFSVLPYVLCALLLLTSSCLLRFDRDGSHDRHDRDSDQHHDEERYDRNRDKDHHGMNLKQESYTRTVVCRQADETGNG